MPRDISNTKKQEIYIQTIKDAMPNPTAIMFDKLFAKHKDSPPEYHTDDIIIISPNDSPFVDTNSVTTTGIYLINKFIIEPMVVFGYINKEFTKDIWGSLEDKIGEAVVAGDLKAEMVWEYIDRTQYLFGGPLAQIVNPSLTNMVLSLPPSAKKLRAKLLEEYKDKIAENDPQTCSMIERKIVDEAMRVFRETNDPALCLFDSGAVDPYNNYKTMFIMKGAIKDNTGESPTGYKIVKSNYDDGVTPDDLPIIADSLVSSAYARGVSTQHSGAKTKQYDAAFQQVKLAKRGTDCNTKLTTRTLITNRYMYRYIVENGKLVFLDNDTIEKYIGKWCELRTPLHCHYPEPRYCSICVGDRPYRIGVHNTGLTINLMSGATMNAALKLMHDSTIKSYETGVQDFLKYVK